MAANTNPISRADCPNDLIIKVFRSTGGIMTVAATKLGINRRSLQNWVNDDPELKAARDEIREEITDLAEGVILTGIKNGSFEAARYYLKCHGTARGWIEKNDSGYERQPLVQQNLIMAADAFDSKFAQILAAAGGSKDTVIDESGREVPSSVQVGLLGKKRTVAP